jgi:hypothetical protein
MEMKTSKLKKPLLRLLTLLRIVRKGAEIKALDFAVGKRRFLTTKGILAWRGF